MRITESQLRRIIREELESEQQAIIFIPPGSQSGVAKIIAYDMGKLEAALTRVDHMGYENEYHGVIAGVYLEQYRETGECNDAWQVKFSVSSRSGWGTKVYLTALDKLGSISSDRTGVTAAAEGLWKRLARMGIVEREPFDDWRDPKTPPTRDDCRVMPARDPVLNSSWRLVGEIPGDVRKLLARGEEHMDELGSVGKRQKALKLLDEAFNFLFSSNYD